MGLGRKDKDLYTEVKRAAVNNPQLAALVSEYEGSNKQETYKRGGKVAKKLTPFQAAFRKARDNKQKTFEFNGKKYTTELKEEKASREAKAADRKKAANATPPANKPKTGGGSISTKRNPPKIPVRPQGAGSTQKERDATKPKPKPKNPLTLGEITKSAGAGAMGAVGLGKIGKAAKGIGALAKGVQKAMGPNGKRTIAGRNARQRKAEEAPSASDVLRARNKKNEDVLTRGRLKERKNRDTARKARATRAENRGYVTPSEAAAMRSGFKHGGSVKGRGKPSRQRTGKGR